MNYHRARAARITSSHTTCMTCSFFAIYFYVLKLMYDFMYVCMCVCENIYYYIIFEHTHTFIYLLLLILKYILKSLIYVY